MQDSFKSYIQKFVLEHLRQEYKGMYSNQGCLAGRNPDNQRALVINYCQTQVQFPLPKCGLQDQRVPRRLGVAMEFRGDTRMAVVPIVLNNAITIQNDGQGKFAIFIKLPSEQFKNAEWISEQYFGGKLLAYAGSSYLKVPVDHKILDQLEKNKDKLLYATWNESLKKYCDSALGNFEQLLAATRKEVAPPHKRGVWQGELKRDLSPHEPRSSKTEIAHNFKQALLDRVAHGLRQGESVGYVVKKGEVPKVNLLFDGREISFVPAAGKGVIKVPIQGLSNEAMSIREVEGRFKVCLSVSRDTAQRFSSYLGVTLHRAGSNSFIAIEPSKEIFTFIKNNKEVFAGSSGDESRVAHMVSVARLKEPTRPSTGKVIVAREGATPQVTQAPLEIERSNLRKYIDLVITRFSHLSKVYSDNDSLGILTTNLTKLRAIRINLNQPFNPSDAPHKKLFTLMSLASLGNQLYTNALSCLSMDILKNADLYQAKEGFGISFIKDAMRASRLYSSRDAQKTFLRSAYEIEDLKLGSLGSKTVVQIMGSNNQELRRYLVNGLKKHSELVSLQQRLDARTIGQGELIRSLRELATRDEESNQRFNKHFSARIKELGAAIRNSKQNIFENAIDFAVIDHPWVSDLLVLTIAAASHITPAAPAGEALAISWFTGRGVAETTLGIIENNPQRAVYGALMSATPLKAARPMLGVVMTSAGLVDASSVIQAGMKYGFSSTDIEALAQTGIFMGLPHALRKLSKLNERKAQQEQNDQLSDTKALPRTAHKNQESLLGRLQATLKQKISFEDGIQNETKQTVYEAIDKLPRKIIKLLLDTGVKIEVRRQIEEGHPSDPDGSKYTAYYDEQTHTIAISEREGYFSFLQDTFVYDMRSQAQILTSMLHETGHAIHGAKTGKALPVPQTVAEAHQKDVDNLSGEQRKNYHYFIQGTEGGSRYTRGVTTYSGRLEAIAQSFSALFGDPSHSSFIQDFPKTCRSVLKEIGGMTDREIDSTYPQLKGK